MYRNLNTCVTLFIVQKRTLKPQAYFAGFSPETVSSSITNSTVKEILAIAEKEIGMKAKDMTVLDVGSGWGIYSLEMEKYVKKVVGVEPYRKLFECAQTEKKKKQSNVQFYNMLIENYTSDYQFDLILSLTTVEHMPNVVASFSNIFKLLKKGGMTYVTAPNKLWPLEVHYKLPFLSILPLSLANKYMQLTGKGDSYEDSSYSKTYFGMKKLFNRYPCSYYFYAPSYDAEYLGCGMKQSLYTTMLRKIGIGLIKNYSIFWTISKGFIMIVKKK